MRFLIEFSCAALLGLGWLYRSFQLDGARKQAQHWYDESRVQSKMIRGLQLMLRSQPTRSSSLSEFTHEDRVPLVEPVEEG